MRVLMADHEPLAQDALGKVLAARSDIPCVDLASDGVEALEKLGKGPYDLLLLDISMLELSSIEALHRLNKRVDARPSVVLVTAHDEHAVGAFERNGVDSVLKLSSKERVGEALDLAVPRTAAEPAAHWAEVLPQRQAPARTSAPKVAIKSRGRIVFIDLREVTAVLAEGNCVSLQRVSGSDLLRESISRVAEKLRPYGFVRIHRSVLVNASLVEEIDVRPSGDYGLRIRGGKEYTVTRTYKKNLKSLAELWIGADPFIAG